MSSIRFDASGDYLSRSVGSSSYAGLTIAGWVKLSSDRNAYSGIFCPENANANGENCLLTSGDGTTLDLYGTGGDHLGSALTVGTWYHLALAIDATDMRAYVNGALDITGPAPAGTLTTFRIGMDAAFEWLDGCAAHIKVWDAKLTAAEIAQEVYTIAPRRFANLLVWSPTFPGATERLADYSGAGNNWTSNGTLADEDGPPVSWGGSSIFLPFAAASGTTYEVALTLTARLEAAAVAAAVREASLTLARLHALAGTAQADFQAAISIAARHGLVGAANADYFAAVTLASLRALQTTNGQTIEAAVTLALTQGVAAARQLIAEASVSVGAVLSQLAAAQANLNASVNLSQVLAVSLVANALLEAQITIASVRSVTTSGSTTVVQVVTPDGRIISIQVDDRTITILEDRVIAIGADDRIITIH